MVGKTLSHYKILEELGRGGMGIVYKAEDIKLHRTVAIKVLPSSALAVEDDRKRFYREARAAAALNHPNIATVYEIDEAQPADFDGVLMPGIGESVPFIAMEYVDGDTIAESIKNGPLKQKDALRIASQIAEALQAAHEKNVVHRDIKSANVMLTGTGNGNVKVLDFGLAKTAESTRLTQLNSTLGTVAYMSPEQARAEDVDGRTDLWALGIVLYEMISGHLPFEGEYEQAVIYSILNADPEHLTAVRSGVARELESIVEKLLRKSASQRYQSAAEVIADLTHVDLNKEKSGLESDLASSEDNSSVESKSITSDSQKWGFLIVVAALVGGVLWLSNRSTIGAGGSIEDRRLVIFPFNVDGNPELDLLGEEMVDVLHLALQGYEDVDSVDPFRVLVGVRSSGAVDELEKGAEFARSFQAGWFVLGNARSLGEQTSFTATLYQVDALDEGRELGRIVVNQELALTSVADSLSQKIVVEILDNPDLPLSTIAASSTNSIEAFKYYLSGLRQLRTGVNDEARESFDQALRLDSTFALAAYQGYTAWFGFSDERLERQESLIQQAIRHAESLPLVFRELVHYRASEITGIDVEQTESMFRRVLGRYPNNAYLLQAYGDFLFHLNPHRGRPATEGREYLERGFELGGGDYLHMVGHLEQFAAYDRDVLELNQVWSLADSLLSTSPSADDRSYRNLLKLMPDKRSEVIDSMVLFQGFRPSFFALHVHDFQTEYRGWTHSSNPSMYRMVRLEAAMGRFSRIAIHRVNPGDDDYGSSLFYRVQAASLPFSSVSFGLLDSLYTEVIAWDTSFVALRRSYEGLQGHVKRYMRGLLAFKTEDVRLLTAVQAEAATFATPGDRGPAMVVSETLLAFLEILDGRKSDALKRLESITPLIPFMHAWSSPLFSQPYGRYVRATLLHDAGRQEEALTIYRSFLTGYHMEDMAIAGVSYLKRAEIFDDLGQDSLAIDAYQRFVEAWRDADPEFQPLVERARERLKELPASISE